MPPSRRYCRTLLPPSARIARPGCLLCVLLQSCIWNNSRFWNLIDRFRSSSKSCFQASQAERSVESMAFRCRNTDLNATLSIVARWRSKKAISSEMVLIAKPCRPKCLRCCHVTFSNIRDSDRRVWRILAKHFKSKDCTNVAWIRNRPRPLEIRGYASR